MDKNIWEQVSAVLECRETGEPLNAILALFGLISLDEGCGSFIILFLLFKKLPQSICKTFLKFVVWPLHFHHSPKVIKKLTSLFGENPYLCRQLSQTHTYGFSYSRFGFLPRSKVGTVFAFEKRICDLTFVFQCRFVEICNHPDVSSYNGKIILCKRD